MGELAKLPRIIGVKDATGDVGRASDQRIACGTDFIQLSGNDDSALGFNAHGGTGCIRSSPTSRRGSRRSSRRRCSPATTPRRSTYQDRLMPLHRAAFAEPNPAPTKFALSLLGKCTEEVRSPMVPLEEPTQGADARRDAARGAAQLTLRARCMEGAAALG